MAIIFHALHRTRARFGSLNDECTAFFIESGSFGVKGCNLQIMLKGKCIILHTFLVGSMEAEAPVFRLVEWMDEDGGSDTFSA